MSISAESSPGTQQRTVVSVGTDVFLPLHYHVINAHPGFSIKSVITTGNEEWSTGMLSMAEHLEVEPILVRPNYETAIQDHTVVAQLDELQA